MSDFEIEIKRYLKNLPPDVLGLCSIKSIEIIDMFSGAYNLNFHVRVNKKEFIFRINIEQGVQAARPLNLLTRYTEMLRDDG